MSKKEILRFTCGRCLRPNLATTGGWGRQAAALGELSRDQLEGAEELFAAALYTQRLPTRQVRAGVVVLSLDALALAFPQ